MRVVFVWLGLFACTLGFGQKPGIFITGSYKDVPFISFQTEVQRQTGLKFFYAPQTLDSVRVTLEADHLEIHQALDQIFAASDLRFAIDDQKHVFLVKGKEIQSNLPDEFKDEQETSSPRGSQAIKYYSGEPRTAEVLLAEASQFDIGKRTNPIGQGVATVAGHVTYASSGEPIAGASVYIESPFTGVATDQFGYFALTVPKGKHELVVKSIGFKNTRRKITVYGDGKLDIEMLEDVTSLKELVVEAEKDKNISSLQMGVDKLDIKTMKKVPTALGELDIFKVMLTLPGVQTVGEASTGLNVRGGATDQNLILFNDAVVFNPAHLFGFFSAFNPDLVKNAELYKSTIPAQYGGRLSSVLDVNTREGNKKKITGSGGIGPVTGRLLLEGPILKDKSSFLIGGRSTYSNWLLREIPNDLVSNSKASFYDLNAVLTHEVNENNSIYGTGYYSSDRFTLNSDTAYQYSNKAATLKWKHIFTNKLYSVLTGSFSGYDYRVTSDANPINAFNLSYALKQFSVKSDFSYFPNSKHSLDFGASAIRYAIRPGSYMPNGSTSVVERDVLPQENGIETAIYAGDQWEISHRLSIYVGMRYSLYSYLGPHDKFIYADGQSKNSEGIIDTVSYAKGPIATYHGPEYRLSLKYMLSGSASLKLSVNRSRQYIQVLSNTTAISPTDVWKLSDSYIRPQVGDQVSLGLYKNLRSNTIETSVEGYYKRMENILDYKGGAKLILNRAIESDVITAEGRAYGVEFMVKKLSGKVNGWISYTYSRSLLRTKGDYESETVNNGRFYASNYDKPHAVNVISNYKFSHRVSTSMNMTYSTGRPITLPIGKYYSEGSYRVLYGPRNGSRIPDYFRIDLAFNLEGNHRIKKLSHSSWTVGVYNLTGRNNAYSVFFDSRNGVTRGYKLSIFGAPIPTVTWNFRF